MRIIYLLSLLASASIQSTNAQFDFPDCFPGQTQFNSTIVTSDYVTGYPTVCINGTFAPVCNGASVGYVGTVILCSQFNITSGYVGTPPNVTLAPLNENDISYTVTDLNCDYLTGCSNPMFSGDDCTNGYLSFTCPLSLCDGPEFSLYNNETTYINGTEVVTGIFGICQDGVLIGYCDDGSIFDGAAQLLCNGLGYLNGEQVASNSRLPLGAAYLTNFMCISTPYGPSNCTEGILATNPACYNGSLDYTLRCSVRRASCDGYNVALNYNTTSIVNGTEYITGVPTQCNDGYIDALCNDGSITQDTTDFLCQSIGYLTGQLLMVNSTQYGTLPQGTAYYTNFTCPANALSLDDCGAILVQCPSAGSSMEVVLQCSRPYSVCEDGAVRFIDGSSGSYDSYDTRTETLSGSLQICVNGEYRYVCGLSNASFNASDIVAAACIQLGYVNSSSSNTNQYFYPSSNPVIESISCPYNGSHFSLCSINTTTDPNSCYDYDRVLGGTCTRITPACTRLFQMADRGTFNYVNGTYVATGRIEACVNNVYYPVCTNGLNNTLSSPPPTYYQLDGVCNNVFYSGYSYLPDQYIGSRSDYYNSTGSTRVISSISCPNGAYRATACNVTFSDNGCSSYGNDAVISCINRAEESFECSGNTVTLANYTSYRSPYGSRYSIGRVVACINGSFATVCDNTAYPEYFAGLACDNSVSNSNYTIVPFDPMYLNGDYNVIVNNCSSTPQNYYDYSYCNNTVTNGICSNGAPLTVRCEAECSSNGQVRLTDTNTVYYSNDTSGTTGNVEYCYNGRWRGICQNNLNDSHARVFCGAFGYNNGSFILSNSSDFTSYVNLSCPDYYFYNPSSCYVLNSFSMCNETSINALLYCYDASSDSCSSNNVRFGSTNSGSSYSSGQYPNVTRYSVGNVEICVNNTYYDVCADQLTPEQALLICRSISYDYNRAYTSAVIGPANEVYSYDASADSISNFTCSNGGFESSCSYDIVYNNGCTNNGGLAVITCIRDAPIPTCNTGSLQLQDRGTGYLNNGTAFSIGRPSICYNNSYIPYCTSFDMNTARAFCGRSQYSYGARPYPIFGSTDDYGYNDQSSLIVSNLTCPVANSSNYNSIYGSCDNSTSTSDIGGCSGIFDEAVISCINRPVPCNLQTNFRYIDYIYFGNGYTEIYQVGVCINATYGDVCSDGITDDVALLFCRSQGGYYNAARVSYSYTNRTYSNYDNDYAGFSCPYYAGSLSSCYDNVSVVNNCSMGYGGILVVECTTLYSTATPTSSPTSGCYYEGQVIFNNTEYSINNNSLYSISGYVSVCVNGTPALVCGDASIGQTELTDICYQTTNLPYGYVGTPPGVTLAPLNVSNDTTVVDDYSCDPETFSCTSTPGSTCPSGYLTVTCPQLCNGPSPQLYNNVSYTSNGIEYVTGIPILCTDFAIIALCNDGSIYDDPASLLCDALGYENGTSINMDQALYGTLPEGTQFYNNYTCPPDAVHYDNCSANFTTNPQCTNSSYNYVIQCSRRERICDEGYFIYNPVNTSSPGYNSVTGIVASCIDNTIYGICNNIGYISNNIPRIFCNSSGFEDGVLISANDTNITEFGSLPLGTTFFANYSCPDNATSFNDCNYDFTFDPQCYYPENNYIVMCYSTIPPCHLQPRFSYLDYYSLSNGYTLTYQVGMCFNYTIGELCANGVTNDTANLLCISNGYTSGAVNTSYANRTYSRYGVNYAGFNCPYYAGSLSSCYDNVSVVNNCSMGYGGFLVITCTYDYGGGSSSSSVITPAPSATISTTELFTSTIESSAFISTGVFTSTIEPSTTSVSTEVFTSTIEPSTTSVSTEVFTSTIEPSTTSVSTEVFTSTIEPSTTSVSTEVFTSTIEPSTTSVSTEVFTSTIEPSTTSVSTEVFTSTIEPSTTSVSTEVFTSTTSSSFSSSVSISASSFSVTPTPSSTPMCTGLFQMADRGTFNYANNTYIATGRIEACVDGVYYPVCTNGLNNTLSSPPSTYYQLDGVCNNVFYSAYSYLPDQYIGSRSDYYNSTGSTRVISSISCPNGAYRATECNVTFSDNGCSSYGNDAVISCINRAEEIFECSGDTIAIANYTSYRSPYGSRYSIGRVVACINGSFVTVCNNTAFPEYFARLACNRVDSYLNYTIVPFDPMYLNGDYNVVFNNCSYTPQYSGDYSNCDDTVSNGVCSDGAPLTVRCEAECSTFGQVRLTDTNTVYYSNGTSGTTGNVEFCNSGTWNGVCQNDLDNSDANIFCRSFGYNNGSFISGGSGSSSSYINITCPNYDYNSPQFCSINGDPFTMCNNPSTLYCYDATAPDDQCYSGQVQIGNNYYYNSYSYGQYPNFTSYTTGNVEICVNNTYYDVCADQLTPEQALFLCRSAGFNADRAYTSAVIGPADEVYSYDASADSITSFTCPYGYFDSFCTYNFVYNNGCTNNGGLAVVSCVRDVETCNTGSPQLQDRGQGYFNNGTAFSIGRPSICYNNSYIPYCTSFDMNTARAFCGSSEYYYGARSYPIFGSTDDYGYNDQSSLIVSYLSCPMVDSSNYNYIFGSCYNSTSTSDNGGCSGISDEAVISCINRPVPCNLQTSLGYIESSYTGDSYTEIYQVGVCINATYGDVCSDGITDDVALLFCRAQGGYYSTASVSYSYTNRTYSNYNNDYAGFSCPYYAGSLSSCYDNVSVVNNCSMGYGGILVVECTQVYAPPTSCYYDGQVIFNNTENSTDNNNLMNSISGYVSVCVNGTPALVCGDASIGQTELASICFQTVGVLYGNIGTPPNVSLAPLNVSNDTIVANDFYCDPETFSCTSTPGSTCPSGYLTVTCPQLCNGPSFQLYNEQFYLSNGIEYVTGIPILCEGFAIIALCNDGSIYDDPASLLCDALGYENGISINSNQALYGTLPTGAQYFNNFTCPPDAVHYDNCTANFTFNRNCASSAYNYVIQCSRPAQIFGTIDVTAVTQLIEEGNTLTLTCSLMTNYPGALPFSWFRGSNLITPSGRVTISNSNPTANSSTGLYTITSQLMIQNTLTGDSGQYLCRVVPSLSDNIAITIRPRNECTINDPSTPCVNGYCVDEVNDYYCVCPNNFIGKNCEIPVSSNSAPVIVTPPMDQDVPLGSLVNLTCVATGAPQPVITWYLEGTLIPGANSPIYIIDSIQPAQRGTYSCRVMNSEGMDQATATVTINNVRQYFTVLTASGQAQLPPNITAVYNQTRDALIGNELSPGSGIIVADLTYALVPGVLGVQFIFTLRVPPMANTNGITNSLNGVTANIAANYPGISFSLVMRFDGCSSETLAVTTGSSLSIMWPEVGIGAVARPNCPCGSLTTNFGAVAMRRCSGTFSAPGVWLAPNTTQCMFDQTTTTLCQLSTNNNSQEVATQLITITDNTEEIDPVDIGVIGTLAEDLAEDASDPQVLGPLMDMMDNILDVPNSVFMESQQSSNGSQRFINTVETIASTLTITSGDSATVIRSKLAIRAQIVDSSSFSGTQLSVSTTSTGTLNSSSLSSSTNANSDASISLPSTLLTTAGVTGPARLGFSAITNGKLFQDTSATVSTIVMSVDVYNNGGSRVPVTGLSDPVMVSFTVTSSNSMSECAFWDSTSFTWSTDGVTTVRTTTGITCRATHLSSFAVVQRGPVSSSTTPTPTPTGVTPPTEPVTEEYSPEPILFVGLIISILLILVAVIGHLASDAQRHCPEGRLLATSHITLMILYFVFVLATAATYTDSTGFCGTFAGLFHYFSLVYFVWLMFEGLFYAVKLRMGIGGNVFTRHFFIVSLIVALVLPAVIVIISAAAGYDYYTVENAFCRPQMHLFYYGYILPMIVIYLLALLNYIISFFLIYCSGMTSAEKQFRKDSVISHYYVGLILFIIFGVVWVFAITGTQYNITGPGSTALQYVFGFFSMIHALLLVILTFARTSDTRLAFRPVTRMIPGQKGQYDFAHDPSVGKATRRETYGLDSSGKYLTNETEAATTAEKEPLASGDVDDEPRYVTTTMTEKEPEASTVVANEEALATEEEDKKTEL